MSNHFSPFQEVNVLAKLADLQETEYHNTVLLHGIIELLIQKGVLTREELLAKARQIDTQLSQQLPSANKVVPFSVPTAPPFS
ncbi:hypothetical protein EDM56_22330 [Brevibacillus fluminis]|uniref:Nitrile hydratase subunit beta n=1 Tax=Brevibacillus fluminis TaxID=511487 RepID=A0A3M8D5P9_9BACL|nr:hypothetical protein [Brevibacillus fluminis]RNB83404.1 hypothetical protein EDM56_22330 [Brevibacillus fluminis]